MGRNQGGVFLPFRGGDILAKHTFLLRNTEYHQNTNHRIRWLYYKIQLNLLQNKYGIHILLNCCEEGLKLMHVGAVLLNSHAQVGKCCTFHINTGLVAGGLNSDSPKLGDGVVVGIGAIVCGGVTIANHVAIGANSVVVKDVMEENVCVAGTPARIVSKNGALMWNKKEEYA